ncbi:MAG TPA: PilC/PilY family type IV pilus protein [Acidobacteriota bacterium]
MMMKLGSDDCRGSGYGLAWFLAVGLGGAALLAASIRTAQAQAGGETCEPMPFDFTESFDDTVYRDPISTVDAWGEGYIQLNPKGSAFGLPPAGDFPSWINTATANDFDGDGWPDFVGSSSVYSQNNQRILALIRNQGFNYAHFLGGGFVDPNYGELKNFGVGHFDIYADRGGNVLGLVKDYIQLHADTACINSGDQDALNASGFPYSCGTGGGSHTTLVSGDFDGLGTVDANGDGVIMNGHSENGFDPSRFNSVDYRPSFDILHLSAQGGSTVSQTKLHTANLYLNQQTVAERNSVLDSNFSNDLQSTFQRVDLIQTNRLKNSNKVGGLGWSATTADAVDLDGDGDLDVVVGNHLGEVLFWQSDRSTKTPSTFTFTVSKLFSTSFGFRGVSTLKVADLDNDGDKDLVVGSVSGPDLQIWLNDGNEVFTKRNVTFIDTFLSFITTRPIACTTPPGCLCDQLVGIKSFRGAATVLILNDFDMDGDQDIVVSSDQFNYESSGKLGAYTYFFPNDGTGNFPLSKERLLYSPRCLRNNNCDFSCFGGLPTDDFVEDMDLGDKLDFDLDGDADFMTADGNHSQAYFLFENEQAGFFNTRGVAQSTSIDTVDDVNQTIVSVRFNSVEESVFSSVGSGSFGPLEDGHDVFVTYEVTANGGKDWEFLADDEIPCNAVRTSGCATNPVSHQFTHFGSDLRWRAILEAQDDEANGEPDSSFQTPRVLELDLTYEVVDCRQYTRSSISVNISNQADPSIPASEIIVAASFEFPSFRGHLYAFDTSALQSFDSADPSSRITSVAEFTCSDPDSSDALERAGIAFLNDNGTPADPSDDVTLFWDAVAQLETQASSDARRIFTARSIDDNDAVQVDQRVDFTVANAENLNDPEFMGQYLPDQSLNYHLGVGDSDVIPLINFVRRSGTNPDEIPLLGDIDHSSPTVISGTASTTFAPHLAIDLRDGDKGAGSGELYSAFLSSVASRLPIVVVGANDGMVHAFALQDGSCEVGGSTLEFQGGDEVWAFIPRNLIPKLKSTRIAGASGVSYNRLPMIDATPAVSDAFIDLGGGPAWRTVAVFGQGPGTGTGDLNYLFAIDLTNTCDPQPLWEWTDAIDLNDGEPGVDNDPELGQTWSVPFIGQALDPGAADRWYAFFGSGYDEDESDADFKGNRFYALDLASGHLAYRSDLIDLDDAADIPNAIPGSPNGVDLDQDGRLDRLYFGDLEGRLVRLDVRSPASAAVSEDNIISATSVSGDNSGWEPCVKANLTSNDEGDALPTPIFVKPAISIREARDGDGNPIRLARIYFGTGADDRAPADTIYAFFALEDEDLAGGACSLIDTDDPDSFVFDTAETQPILLADELGNPTGERVWADPLILTNTCSRGGTAEAILFTTLVGSIENTNPCVNADIADSPFPGRLFARFIGNDCVGGPSITSGETGFLDAQGNRTVEYLTTASKARGLGGIGQRQTYQKEGESQQTAGQVFYFSQYAGSGTDGASEGGTHNSSAWFEWGVDLGLIPRIRSFEEIF